MAFNYRNTLDNALSALPQRFSDQVLSEVGNRILKVSAISSKLFAFRVPPETQELLSESGVELSPVAYLSHSHPACKMLENHFLYVVLPNLLQHENSVGLMSLRESKMKRFIKMRRFLKLGEFPTKAVKMFNASVDGKDLYRYGTQASVTSLSDRLDRIANEYADGFNARVMLLHDELHFHSPETIADLFERVGQLRSIVCTLVCPVELLCGEKKSKNPRIYGFETSGDDLFFFPDNCPSEGYHQRISDSVWPLQISRIVKGSLSLRVTVLQSIFSHHLISIERTSCPAEKIKFYKKPSCLLKEELAILSANLTDSVVERKTMGAILLYLSCLKSPNQESALAKLRQLEKRELFQDELQIVAAISGTFEKVRGWQNLSLSLVEELKRRVCKTFPWVASFIFEDEVWKCIYTRFLSEMSVKWFRVNLKEHVIQNGITGCLLNPILITKKTTQGVKDLRAATDSIANAFQESINEVCQVSRDEFKTANGHDPCSATVDSTAAAPVSKSLDNDVDSDDEISIADEDRVDVTDNGTRDGVAQCRAENIGRNCLKFKADRFRSNSCVIRSIASQMDLSADEVFEIIYSGDPEDDLLDLLDGDQALGVKEIGQIANIIGKNLRCLFEGNEVSFGFGEQIFLNLSKGHCTPATSSLFKSVYSKVRVPALGCVSMPFKMKNAKKLAESFLRGSTGVLVSSSEEVKQSVTEISELLSATERKFRVDISYTWGAPGSGKTKSLIDCINDNRSISALVVSPRRLLAEDWIKSTKGSSCRVCTFESVFGIDTKRFNCIIIDEVSLYPPGYLDLLSVKVICDRVRKGVSGLPKNVEEFERKIDQCLEGVHFVAVGDPMQARYYSENDEIMLPKENDIDRLVKIGARKTMWKTHRMGKWFEKVVEIKCHRVTPSDHDDFKFYSGMSAIKGRSYDAILCASREDKKDFSGEYPVYTFGEAQGLTFNRCLIGLTDRLHRVNDYHIFVGLTRSVNQFDFILSSDREINFFICGFEKKLLGMVLNREQIKKERLANLFKGVEPIFVEEERFGVNIQEKSKLDVLIQPFCNLSDTVEVQQIEDTKVEIENPWVKSHLPIISHNPLLPDMFDRLRLKETREAYKHGVGYSDQFVDLDVGMVQNALGTPFRFEAIFPRHKMSDNLTFLMAVKKRLRFSNPVEESNEYRRLRCKGERLAEFFIRSLPNRLEVQSFDIEKANDDFISKRLSKPGHMWSNHSTRSDIDWPINEVFLFMKSQLCTKNEKMFVDAKAGQTLACFQHIVLFRFGPMLRAIESAFTRACGQKFYIHNGKNFDELNEFVTENEGNFCNSSVESDYEAFDSSQDGLILAFEVALLRKIGVSSDFIQDYIDLKVNLGSRIGNFAIMRFTGEFCTFLFNTMANMLFTFLTYDVRKDSRILFAGDDMASIGKLSRSEDPFKKEMLMNFRLKAKVLEQRFPMFCGWKLTPEGIYKLPELLWARICVMSERGQIKDCIDNYLLELKFGYELSDSLFKYLDERQMEFHYCCVRFFIEKSYMCKGESAKILRTFGCTFGSEQAKNEMGSNSWVVNSLNLRNLNQRKMHLLSSMDNKSIGNYQSSVERSEVVKRDLFRSLASLNTKKMGEEKLKQFDLQPRSQLVMKNILKSFESLHLEKDRVRPVELQRPNLSNERQLSADHSKATEKSMCKGVQLFKKYITSMAKAGLGGHIRSIKSLTTRDVKLYLGQSKDYLKQMVLSNLGALSRCLWLKLMMLSSGQIQRISKLMPYNHQMYTGMRVFCIQKFLTAYGGLSLISKSVQLRLKVPSCQSFQSLIMMRLNGLKGKVVSTTTSISGQYLFASALLFQMLKRLLDKPWLLTQQFTVVSSLLSPGMNCHLTKVPAAFWFVQHIVYQSLIDIYRGLYKLQSNLKDLAAMKVGRHLQLMSESCIGCPTAQDSSQEGLEVQVGSNKRCVGFRDSAFLRRSLEVLKFGTKLAWNPLNVSPESKGEASSCQENCQGEDATGQLESQVKEMPAAQLEGLTEDQLMKLLSQVWGNLGLPLYDLNQESKNCLENMSLKEVMRGTVRSRLGRFLWDNYVDPDRVLIALADLPALPNSPTNGHDVIYERVLGHYCKFLFGNIAILGTSSKVIWPNVEVPIPRIAFRIEAGGTDHDVSFYTNLNLLEVCTAISTWKRSSDVAHIRNGTFRYLCEAFARDAYDFLFERRDNGVSTNIYEKWPRAFDAAPWVAFDFAGGLNMQRLSAEERTVIDRMTKRLFRTEGQKMVFNAQGEVNFSLEG